MHILVVLLCVSAIIFAFVRGLKGTIFEVSIKRKSFGGVIMGKEIFLYVVLGVILFEILGFNSFHTFYVTKDSQREATYFTLYAVFFFLISLSFFSKCIFGKYLRSASEVSLKSSLPGKEILLLKASSVALIVILLTMYGFGMRNAFLQAIISGRDLMDVRLANTYGTSLPSFVTSYCTFLTVLVSVCVGINYSRLSTNAKIFFILLLIYAASFHGGKEPIVNAFIMVFLGRLAQREKVTVGKGVWLTLIGVPIVFAALYFVALVQFPGLTVEGYVQFLATRLGIGQIQGVYEQFGLQWRNPSYIFQAIPFSNFFVHVSHYNKDLMMATWGLGQDRDGTGVMNSFFIGEALVIGGYALVIFSPMIVAFNYCTIATSFILVFRKMIGFPIDRAKKFVALMAPGLVRLTGDMDGVMLFKLNVMLVIFFLTVAIIYRVVRRPKPIEVS